MCNLYNWFETLFQDKKMNERDYSSVIYGYESKNNEINSPNYWRCLSGNIHPNKQQYCTCINDNLNFEKLV